jgi:hypothetical protein
MTRAPAPAHALRHSSRHFIIGGMRSPLIRRCIRDALLFGLAAAAGLAADAATLAANPVVVAVRHGDCAGAVNRVNRDPASNDAETAFLAGRMLDEGICVQKDPATAAHFFARAADLGDHSAEIDYAAKVGLGEGVQQNYERAGMLCRQAGVDPQSTMQTYALGYACTVSNVAAERLRQSLPRGAFRPNSGPLLVDFTPGTAQMRVHATPRVGVDELHTGSNLRLPLIDAHKEIEAAWRNAIATVPKPDASHLDNETIELALDVDMTLEGGHEPSQRTSSQNFGSITRGDIRPEGQ